VVFFNYTTMQVSAKIVYYGAGLCGKTTNLQYIHHKTDPRSRGEMVSLETEADRTLFFDLLPLEVGTIGGMRVRVQLYTVPGQVFYNTTRKLVLKGVDGIVFVVDSQVAALDANLESLGNLKENLNELNQPLEQIPFIFQFNKRDIRNIHSVETLNRCLNSNGYDHYGAAALHGVGVFETLKAISKKTLAAVHRRIAGPQKKQTVAVPSGFDLGSPVQAEHTPAGVGPVTASIDPSIPPYSIVGAGSDALKQHTDEVKVEFAASLDATPATEPAGEPRSTVPRVATRSRVDIERELERVRRMALGGSAASGKRRSQGQSQIRDELRRDLKIRLPRATLEKAKHLTLDVSIGGADAAHTVTEAIRMELPERRSGDKTRLQITLDLEGEDT
jgi:signal recognition particle receptor subunit beta